MSSDYHLLSFKYVSNSNAIIFHPIKASHFYLLLQFGSLAYFVFFEDFLVPSSLIIFQLAGVATGLWAIYEMRKSKLSIAPEIQKGAHLVTTGIYNEVRHPMYLALVLVTVPIVVHHFYWKNILVEIILLYALVSKIRLEEKLWSNKDFRYAKYKQETSRLIPWVW